MGAKALDVLCIFSNASSVDFLVHSVFSLGLLNITQHYTRPDS